MKNNSVQSFVEKVAAGLILALAFLSPLLTLPIFIDFITNTKFLLLFITALGLGFAFTVSTIRKKSWELTLSPLTLPLFFFGIAAAASVFLTTSYPGKALVGYGGTYLALVLIALLGGSLLSTRSSKKLVNVLGISAAVLGITSLLQLLGWGPSHLINAIGGYNLPHNLLFNLSGNSLVSLEISLLALVGLVAQVLITRRLSTLHSILIPVILLGAGISIWSLLPGKIAAVSMLPTAASWSITLDTLRSPRSALIGFGTDSYASAYATLRPSWINGLDLWQFDFGSARNLPLTLIVTTGLAGLISWLLLAFRSFKQLSKTSIKNLPVSWILAASFILLFLAPGNPVLLSIQAVTLACWIAGLKQYFPTLQFKTLAIQKHPAHINPPLVRPDQQNWLTMAAAGLLTLLLVYASYFLGKSFLSFNRLAQAATAIGENDALKVYNFQREAVLLTPQIDYVRRQYALTNLQIAIALSNKTDVTPEERTQVTELISQAVREARAATTLDATNYQNWATLAEIYKNLIGTSEEANQWAVNSMVSAIQVYPTSPLLRVSLGQLFFNEEQYEDALRYFNQAAELKPDLAMPYYQLAQTLLKLEQFLQARSALQQTLLLLEVDSEDYAAVSKNLEEVEAVIEERGLDQPPPQQGVQGQGLPPGQQVPFQPEQPPMDSESALPPLTEQNVEQTPLDLINQAGGEPLDLTEETTEAINNPEPTLTSNPEPTEEPPPEPAAAE